MTLQEELGQNFIPIVFDVRDQDAIDQAVLELEDRLHNQGLHGLVNNAGIAVNGPLEHIPIEQFAYQMDVNVTGIIRVTQAFLPMLGTNKTKYKHRGRIVNIGSISGIMTRPFFGPYSASKHAVEAISDAMRRELEPFHGIKVSLIQAGPVKTPIWTKAKAEGNRFKHTVYHEVLRHRNKLINKSQKMALDTVEISKIIHKALTDKNPKTRYMPTKHKLMIKLLGQVLPDRLSDMIYTKYLNRLWENKDQNPSR